MKTKLFIPVLCLCLFGAAQHPAATAHKDDDHAGHAGHDHGAEGRAAEGAKEHADEVKLTADAVRANGIKIGTAAKQTLAPTFTVPARVAFNAEAMAHVGSPVKGRAVEIKARIGESVKKGADLIVVESPELGEAQSDLLQKRTAVTVVQSAVGPARESYERAKALFDENGGISLAEVRKRLADWKTAEGGLETAKAAAHAAENKLHLLGMSQPELETLLKSGEVNPRYVLHAPIGGTVIEREVTQGELVNPDRDALLVLADMSTVWVWVDVPEARLGEVRVGTEAKVMTAAAKETFTGKITQIAPQIDPAARTGRIRVEVANGEGHLRPGMFARAELVVGSDASEAVLAIPEEAVQTVEGAPAVFVPVDGEENTFAKREVKIAKAVGGMVPVMSGLKEGEKFVAAGSFILKAELGKAGASHEH
jgi:cobalt-zinc-cadmium efflux system membrane fusion protein